jgi:transposase
MNNYFLGCDVSKGYADFVIIDERKYVVEKNFQLDDTFNGHNQLFQILKYFIEKDSEAFLYAAVESTGGYENNWFQTFKKFSRELPVKVVRINPFAIAHSNKAAMKRVTNDRISASTIAEYQIHHPEKLQYNQDDAYQTFKRLVTTTLMLKKTKSQFVNELETLLYVANPEIIKYRKSKIPQWLLRVLQYFPDAASLATASVENLSQIAFIKPARANEIIQAAQQSIASASDEMIRLAITSTVETIIALDKKIDQHIKLLQKQLMVPQIELLQTFKCIGLLSAIELYIEIGCIERFPTVKHLVSFFGVHPVYKESGDGIWGVGMSKMGRRKPRAILFMVALNAIQHNELIRSVYQRELKKGKAKMAALGVCMHKILRIIYGMLKNNTAFDPEIDRTNQQKRVTKTKKEKIDNKRRFQKEDLNAPISKKQTRKRKKRKLSQSDNITINGISVPAPSNV